MCSRADELLDDSAIGEMLRLPLEQRQVRNRRDRDFRFVELRIDGGRLQGRIAAIGPTEDRQALWIGDSLRDEVFGGCGDIAGGGLPVLETIGALPLVAIAGRAAVIGLDDRIAARG